MTPGHTVLHSRLRERRVTKLQATPSTFCSQASLSYPLPSTPPLRYSDQMSPLPAVPVTLLMSGATMLFPLLLC